MSIRTDYEARNRVGLVLHTFADLDLAKAWARKNADRHDGLEIMEVVREERRRRVYRPQIRLVPSQTQRSA